MIVNEKVVFKASHPSYVAAAITEMHFGWRLAALGLAIGAVYVIDLNRHFIPYDAGWILFVLSLFLLLAGTGKLLLGFLELHALKQATGRVRETTQEEERFQDTRLYGQKKNNNITLSTVTLSMRNWRQLGDAVRRNRWKMTKRLVNDAGVMRNINRNYPILRREFERLEWCDKQGWMTGEGKAALQSENPPNFNGGTENGTNGTET